jgi:hypothetical protein
MATAQEEGFVGSYDETFRLELETGEPFDVKAHDDAGDLCRMAVSYFDAQRLRLHIDKAGVLFNDDGYRVHGVRLISATPDSKYANMPHAPGGGIVAARIDDGA